MAVREVQIAVEGEAGDDGTPWTAGALRDLRDRINRETDGYAWFNKDASGRLVLTARGDDGRPGQVRRAVRGDGLDGERLAAAARKRETKEARRREQVAAGGFRVRSYEGDDRG